MSDVFALLSCFFLASKGSPKMDMRRRQRDTFEARLIVICKFVFCVAAMTKKTPEGRRIAREFFRFRFACASQIWPVISIHKNAKARACWWSCGALTTVNVSTNPSLSCTLHHSRGVSFSCHAARTKSGTVREFSYYPLQPVTFFYTHFRPAARAGIRSHFSRVLLIGFPRFLLIGSLCRVRSDKLLKTRLRIASKTPFLALSFCGGILVPVLKV